MAICVCVFGLHVCVKVLYIYNELYKMMSVRYTWEIFKCLLALAHFPLGTRSFSLFTIILWKEKGKRTSGKDLVAVRKDYYNFDQNVVDKNLIPTWWAWRSLSCFVSGMSMPVFVMEIFAILHIRSRLLSFPTPWLLMISLLCHAVCFHCLSLGGRQGCCRLLLPSLLAVCI